MFQHQQKCKYYATVCFAIATFLTQLLSLFYLSQFSAKVLELARKQRMNTEVRTNIFCVVMTSEDYLDAFEKLLRFVTVTVKVFVSLLSGLTKNRKN